MIVALHTGVIVLFFGSWEGAVRVVLHWTADMQIGIYPLLFTETLDEAKKRETKYNTTMCPTSEIESHDEGAIRQKRISRYITNFITVITFPRALQLENNNHC